MLLSEETDQEPPHSLGRPGVFARVASFSHRRRWRAPAVRQRVETMLAEVTEQPEVAQVRRLYEDPAAIAPDDPIGYATVLLNVPAKDMKKEDAKRVYDVTQEAAGDRLDAGGLPRTDHPGFGDEFAQLLAAVSGIAAEDRRTGVGRDGDRAGAREGAG